MAMELQHIIHRVVRKQLFPQLVQEEALLSGSTVSTDNLLHSSSSTSSSLSSTSSSNPSSSLLLSQTFPSGSSSRQNLQHNSTPSLLLHPLNNNNNSHHLSSTSFLSLNNRPDAKERRRLVQRTRVLKTDIQKFETEFKTVHGYEPKSINDRNNMNNVYEELRKLKLIIRDNAALHIQSIYRGYKARQIFQRMKTSTKIAAAGNTGNGTNNPKGVSNENSKSGSGTTTATGNALLSEAMLKLSQLRDEKANLKRQLRQFDIDFAHSHQGRVPTKAEKEHLRPAYTRYHALKNLITDAEIAAGVTSSSSSSKDRGDSPPPPPLPSSSSSSGTTGPVTTTTGPVNASKSSGTTTGAGSSSTPVTVKPTLITSSSNSSLSSVGSTVAANDNTRLRSDSGASGIGLDADDDLDALLNNPNDTTEPKMGGSSTSLTNEQIMALRTEKKKLQAQLREYEKEFLNRNGRSVKYVKDINPVMSKYTRYKALKAQLKELGIQ